MLTKEAIYEIEDQLIGDCELFGADQEYAQELCNYISGIQSFARALIEKIDQSEVNAERNAKESEG